MTARFHVVVRFDADGAHLLLATDHMLGRRNELLGQAAMGDEHDPNHLPVPAFARRLRRSGFEVTVADARGPPLIAQGGREPFRDEDGAVATAGTAQGDGQIALSFTLIGRNQTL